MQTELCDNFVNLCDINGLKLNAAKKKSTIISTGNKLKTLDNPGFRNIVDHSVLKYYQTCK